MNYSELSGLFKDIIALSNKAKDYKLTKVILEHLTMDMHQENIDLKHKIEKIENDNDFSENI